MLDRFVSRAVVSEKYERKRISLLYELNTTTLQRIYKNVQRRLELLL